LCGAIVNRILKETGAYIVVSSAWRANGRLGWLRNKFAEWGIHAAKSRTVGMTPDLRRRNPAWQEIQRGHEIEAWLTANPTTDRFVILDDDSDMNGLSKFLVQTEFKKGLTAEHANRAVEMLTN
jgi:hypothetical protein